MADIEELSVGISGVASWGSGLRLMDGDILLVQSERVLSVHGIEQLRQSIEFDLRRVGVVNPKVIVSHTNLSFSVIGRS